MKTGGKDMKLLKIESSRGYYMNDQGSFSSLDKITKEDLLRLAKLSLSSDVEFDRYDDSVLKHQADQILYKSIYEKLEGLKSRKQEFQDESDRLYLKEYEKYKANLQPQDSEAEQL